MNLFPWYLVRENAIPTNEFQSFRNETLIKIIRQYIAAEQKARQQKNICIPMLEKEYAASRDNRLLTLKRKLFNEKPIRSENIDVPFQLQKELQEYTGLMEEMSALKQAYEHSLIQMGIENRQDLQRIFAEHNSILNPLPLLNRNFHHKLTKYLLESPSSHKAKTRKLDFQLSRILSRSTLKTSPFSSFTSVSLKKWGEKTKTRKQYWTRINFYILQKIIDVLAREEGIRETVYFRMAPKKEREEAWVFTIQMDVNRGKIFNNVDKTIAVKKNALLHIIDELFQKRGTILYKDLAEALKPQAGKEGAEAFLAALIKNNILFPNAAVDEFAEYPKESFQMQLSIFAQQNEKAKHVLEVFHEISRLLQAYENENGFDRFQLNEQIGEKVAETGSILGVVFQQDLVFYEDYVDDSIQGHQQLQHVIQREESTLHSIQKLSLLCNTTMELRSEFAYHFRLQYGSGKVPASQTDVYDLYMNIVRLFTKWTDVLAPVEGLESPLAQKMEIYKAEVKRLFQQAKNDDIKSELDVGKIDTLYEDYQAHFRAKADSSTVMFQLEDGKMIVNKVYSGKLRLFLRFFHYYQELLESRYPNQYDILEKLHRTTFTMKGLKNKNIARFFEENGLNGGSENVNLYFNEAVCEAPYGSLCVIETTYKGLVIFQKRDEDAQRIFNDFVHYNGTRLSKLGEKTFPLHIFLAVIESFFGSETKHVFKFVNPDGSVDEVIAANDITKTHSYFERGTKQLLSGLELISAFEKTIKRKFIANFSYNNVQFSENNQYAVSQYWLSYLHNGSETACYLGVRLS